MRFSVLKVFVNFGRSLRKVLVRGRDLKEEEDLKNEEVKAEVDLEKEDPEEEVSEEEEVSGEEEVSEEEESREEECKKCGNHQEFIDAAQEAVLFRVSRWCKRYVLDMH